jgi:hypothetical protein
MDREGFENGEIFFANFLGGFTWEFFGGFRDCFGWKGVGQGKRVAKGWIGLFLAC